MIDEETHTFFKCTVHGFHTLNKSNTSGLELGGGVPSQTMELQQMGVVWMDRAAQIPEDLTNDDKMFFMKYPLRLM